MNAISSAVTDFRRRRKSSGKTFSILEQDQTVVAVTTTAVVSSGSITRLDEDLRIFDGANLDDLPSFMSIEGDGSLVLWDVEPVTVRSSEDWERGEQFAGELLDWLELVGRPDALPVVLRRIVQAQVLAGDGSDTTLGFITALTA